MISFSVSVNTKKLESIINRIQKSSEEEVRVGIFYESVYPDGIPVAAVAEWNDRGKVDPSNGVFMPPRPFMTIGFRDVALSHKFRKLHYELFQKIITGKITVKEAYRRIGEEASKDLKKVIDQWTTPPNAELTIMLKGADDPLVDTQQMMDSVTYKVMKSRKQRTIKLRKKSTVRVR
jgi:hypothetical protein